MRGRLAAAVRLPVLALALGGLVLAGCLGRVQGFEAYGQHWTIDLDDRTATVASIHVLDQPVAGDGLASDAVRVRNATPTVVELAWVGGACFDCAHFSLAPGRDAEIQLRYDIGPPCDDPMTVGYAFEIRFARPIDARTITAVPAWSP